MTNTPNVPIAQIEMAPIEGLKPNSRNARTHSRRQIKAITKSTKAFGFLNPVLIGEDTTILAGHGRVEAAKHLGMRRFSQEEEAYILARTFTKITSRLPVAPPFCPRGAARVSCGVGKRTFERALGQLWILRPQHGFRCWGVGSRLHQFHQLSLAVSLRRQLIRCSFCGRRVNPRASRSLHGWPRDLSYLEPASDTSYLRLSGLRSAFIISRGFAERD
jgi:hypothetical protein